jgi:hypothetical protein
MTKPHRATPEQWESIERWAEDNVYDACFLELRARIEDLEADALEQARSQEFCLDHIIRRLEKLEAAQHAHVEAKAVEAGPDSIEDRIAKADAAIEASMERIRTIAAPARAALAQPELVAPTDDELLKLLSRASGLPDCDTYIVDGGRIMSEPNELLAFARAVLACYSTPANNISEENFND